MSNENSFGIAALKLCVGNVVLILWLGSFAVGSTSGLPDCVLAAIPSKVLAQGGQQWAGILSSFPSHPQVCSRSTNKYLGRKTLGPLRVESRYSVDDGSSR